MSPKGPFAFFDILPQIGCLKKRKGSLLLHFSKWDFSKLSFFVLESGFLSGPARYIRSKLRVIKGGRGKVRKYCALSEVLTSYPKYIAFTKEEGEVRKYCAISEF